MLACCREYGSVQEDCPKDREVDHGEGDEVQKAQKSEARSGIPQAEGNQGFRTQEDGDAKIRRSQGPGPQGGGQAKAGGQKSGREAGPQTRNGCSEASRQTRPETGHASRGEARHAGSGYGEARGPSATRRASSDGPAGRSRAGRATSSASGAATGSTSYTAKAGITTDGRPRHRDAPPAGPRDATTASAGGTLIVTTHVLAFLRGSHTVGWQRRRIGR